MTASVPSRLLPAFSLARPWRLSYRSPDYVLPKIFKNPNKVQEIIYYRSIYDGDELRRIRHLQMLEYNQCPELLPQRP